MGLPGLKAKLKESYYSLEIETVKPDDIGHHATRGWISSDGTIYSGAGDHDSILRRILKAQDKPRKGSGWIRWIASGHNILFLDWSEYGNNQSEGLARSITKQTSFPFEKVWIDALADDGSWISWKGPLDDFIKFGVKGRSGFSARLEEALRRI